MGKRRDAARAEASAEREHGRTGPQRPSTALTAEQVASSQAFRDAAPWLKREVADDLRAGRPLSEEARRVLRRAERARKIPSPTSEGG